MRGGTPGTRSAPPPQRPSSGRRRQPQHFFTPTARSSTSGFRRLAAKLHCSSRTRLRRRDLLAAARGHQCPLGQEPAPREELVRGNAMAASYQAYRHARLERLLDDPDFLRRCPAPTALNRRDNLNSIRRIGHRHGCMPLAKWETGSGRFGGCLIKTRSPNSADRGQAFKRLAHYLMICIKSDLVPRVWRACHCSAISLIRPFFCALLTYSSLTNY